LGTTYLLWFVGAWKTMKFTKLMTKGMKMVKRLPFFRSDFRLTGVPNPPTLTHSRSDISADDNLDTEIPKEFKRRSRKSAEDRYLSGLPSAPKSARKKKKVQFVDSCQSLIDLFIFRRKRKNRLVHLPSNI
jgi:hypothetical protein